MAELQLVRAGSTPEEDAIVALHRLLRDVTEGMLKACDEGGIKLRQELTASPVGTIVPYDSTLVAAERLLVSDRLERFGGNTKLAAESLGVGVWTVREIRRGGVCALSKEEREKGIGKDWRKGVRGPCQRQQ